MNLRGIENENEFFPAGFFSGALETELNVAVSSWESYESLKNPVKRLSAAGAGYRQIEQQWCRVSD